MFEIPVENRFESDEICEKMTKKVTKMEVWGGSGAEWGPEPFQDPKKLKGATHFGGHFGASLTSKM